MIDQFISEIKNRALANNNRYYVDIFSVPGNRDPEMPKLQRLFCASAVLPGITFEPVAQKMFGEERKFAFQRSFGDAAFTFYCDSDMKIKTVFDQWANNIVNPRTREAHYHDDYVRDIIVTLLDKSDKPTYKIKLIECWPSSIGDIALSQESKEFITLEVTMSYKYWVPLTPSTLDISVAGLPATGTGDVAGIATGGS